jgi:hypothetical protein
MMTLMPRVLPRDVQEIVAMDDEPVLRNLRITQAYHELSLDLRALVRPPDVCWSGFACWASKQAGAFIRREELPAVLRRLADDPGRLGALERVVDGIAANVMLGNRTVFAEMGDAFARFVLAFEGDTRPDPAKLETFLATFSEGPSLPDLVQHDADGQPVGRGVTQGGQSMLRRALACLHAAMFEPVAERRAELVLLSSALFGLHEQTRLQPYIAGAQDGPMHRLLASWGRGDAELAGLAGLARDLATELVMTMRVPGQTLHLGRDLEAPPGTVLWPPSLERLEHPELVALTVALGTYDSREHDLDRSDRMEAWLDRSLGAVGLGQREAQGTGARDWSSLQQRMRFIFELFRSRQQHEPLLEPPFSAEQVAALRRGELPSGEL